MTSPAVPAEVQSLPTRLRQVQLDVEDAQEALKLRLEQRRRLVVQIVDEGAMSQRAVARALGDKSPGLVVWILAQPGPNDEG